MHQAVILQAQGVFFLPAAIAVALAAGLGAPASVAGAAADGGGQVALAAVAHAQSPVGENLNFDGGVCADVPNFLPAQLPAEHHPLHAHGGAQLHPGQGMDGHLGGAVDRNVGRNLAAQLHDTQVLDDKGIDIVLGGVADELRRLLHFPVGDQGVQSQVHIHAPDVAVFHRIHQSLGGEILGALAGVQIPHAQVHRVGTVLHRGPQGLHGTGGGQ